MVGRHTVEVCSHLESKKSLVGGWWVVGGRPNLMLAQVLVFCPGPGQDLAGLDLDWTWTGPGMDLEWTWNGP